MATIDIKAVYADMLKCAQILEDIGADVKVAYTDMDDFLNKKMVFNGKQIYANWQSDARSVFEEKAKVIVDVFTKVQEECNEASNTLKAVIKEYENRDSELAATTLGKNIGTKPLDFKNFGNMASADWTGLKKPDYSSVIASAAKIKPGLVVQGKEPALTVYAPPSVKPNTDNKVQMGIKSETSKKVYMAPSVTPNTDTEKKPISSSIQIHNLVYMAPSVTPNTDTEKKPTYIPISSIHTHNEVYAGPSVTPKPVVPTVKPPEPTPVINAVYAPAPFITKDDKITPTVPTVNPTPTINAVYAPAPFITKNDTIKPISNISEAQRFVYAPAPVTKKYTITTEAPTIKPTGVRTAVYAPAPLKEITTREIQMKPEKMQLCVYAPAPLREYNPNTSNQLVFKTSSGKPLTTSSNTYTYKTSSSVLKSNK